MSTKEMNASEVNAVQATINHVNLLNRFNYLTEGMDDWKMPICARIPTEHFDEYNEACIHFTGTELQTMNTYSNGTSKVYAKGYYMMGE